MARRLSFISFSLALGLIWVVLILFGLSGAAPVQAASTLCVQPGNPNCYNTISTALAASHAADTIRVAAGTYIEYVVINKTVTLQGGWNAAFTQRDPKLNVTTIRPPDASFSVVSIQGQFGDPSAVAPTLDGFTITGGGGGNHGGGLRITSSNAIVSNNVITGNLGYLLGGGVWVQNGAPLLQNNHIQNNHILQSSGGWGGGVDLENTQAQLIGNVIAGNSTNNSYAFGGGVAVQDGGPVSLANNTIISNTAATITSTIPAGDQGYGGGVYVAGAPVNLTGNLIQGNKANGVHALGFGGAYGYGGGVFVSGSSAFTLTGNTINKNIAGYKYYVYLSGGGVQVENSAGSLNANVIVSNQANGNVLFGDGGGLAVLTSTLTIQGGQILSNTTAINCEGYGGGLYARASQVSLNAVTLRANSAANTPFYGLGGGLAFFNTPYTLTNSLVANNRSFVSDSAVGGLYAGPKSPGYLVNNSFVNNKAQGIRSASPITLTNNIIMGHTTGISMTAVVPVSATYNDFYNNTTQQRGFALNNTNISINPQLDAAYHLPAISPAVDAGTRLNAPLTDIDGQPRPMAGSSGLYRFDIGADEFSGPAQVNRSLAKQPADFTLIGPGNPQDDPTSDGSNDWIGYAVSGGDINGDNRADLVVGAPNMSSRFSGGPNDDGRVFAVYNSAARRLGVTDIYSTAPSLEVRSWLHQQHIGQSFAESDLNGDGKRDLIIGASGAANFDVTGTVFVFAGGPSLNATLTLSPTMQAAYRMRSDQDTSSFAGANALAAGQLNGSGPDDLAVGEAGASAAGRAGAGKVYVFFGSPSLPALWDLRVISASLTIFGPAVNAGLGKVAVADVTGDGQPDLVARSSGALYVFAGPLSPGVIDLASNTAHTVLTGLRDGPLALGDVDGEGAADIILGDGSQVRVLRGGSYAPMATFSAISTPRSLAALDWNGDGKAEIVVGQSDRETTYVIMGSAALSGSTSILDRADWVITGERLGDQFGWSLGSGDLDGDGVSDLIIGSRSHVLTTRVDPHFNDAGAVYILYGTSGQSRIFLPLIK